MSHGRPSQPAPPPDTSRRHEITDAQAGGLVVFAVCMVVTLAVVVLITLGLFYAFTYHEDSAQDAEFAASPLVSQRSPSPAPPLQPSKGHETLPFQDAVTLRAENDRLAGTYGDDVMADNAVHHRIPIEAAIALMSSDGVPTNSATDIPTPQGTAPSMPTPYGEGGRGAKTGAAAAPGVPGQ
jgi:hypothetical protein